MTFKKENSGGRKFQGRQQGEKRSRTSAPREKSPFSKNSTENGSNHYNRSSDRTERSPFSKNGESNRPFQKPRFGEERGGDKRDRPFNKPRFGDDSRGSDRKDKPFGKPRFGDDRAGDKRERPFSKARFGDDSRGGDRKENPFSKPRFGADRAGDKRERPFNKPRFGEDSRGGDRKDKPFGKPRFGDDRGGDKRERPFNKPRFGDDSRGSDRKDKPFGKPRFGDDRSGDKRERPFNKPSEGKFSSGSSRSFGSKPTFNKPNDRDRGKAYGDAKNTFKSSNASTERSFENRENKRPFNPRAKKTEVFPGEVKNEKRRKDAFDGIDKNQYIDASKNFKGRGRKYNQKAEDLLKGKELIEGEVRLNRYIANSGMCSRREADVMIEQGLVFVNNVVVTQLGTKVMPGSDVRVDGKRINPERPVYIILNKPKGFITSTTDPNERATVLDLIDLPGKERVYPIGRLDRNTTGVLLLTNDGELAQKLTHPSFEIKKIYKAKLDKRPSKEHMLAWVNGVELEDGPMSFEQIGFVEEEADNVLGLEVHSGRNRVVRRMFEHFGYEVKSLDRAMIGEFDHLKLGRGKWRFLNEKEINYVERIKRMKGKKSKTGV